MLLLQLVLHLTLLLSSVLAAKDDKKEKPQNVTVEKSVQLKTHSIYAPYIDQDLQNRWWDFGADAYINTNKHIRLTRARRSETGWLWSRLPITSQNFIVEVEFKISSELGHLAGDGLALWLTPTRAQPGPVFGSIDRFEGLGVFLDSYANSRHSYAFPRIMAMLGDGSTSYDVGNDGDKNSVGACSANYRKATVPTKLRLTYIKDISIDVKVQYKAWEEWSDCFKIEPVSLPQTLYLGLSALTGDVFDEHDVISVSTYTAVANDASKSTKSLKKNRFGTDEDGGSWISFLVKLFLVAGVCVGLLYGYRTYSLGKTGLPGARVRNAFQGDMFNSGKRF